MTPAARAFGKFQDSFLAELHAEILLHARQEVTGVVPKPVEGITVHDSDVLEPAPARPGGLMRLDTVRATAHSISKTLIIACSDILSDNQRNSNHLHRAPQYSVSIGSLRKSVQLQRPMETRTAVGRKYVWTTAQNRFSRVRLSESAMHALTESASSKYACSNG